MSETHITSGAAVVDRDRNMRHTYGPSTPDNHAVLRLGGRCSRINRCTRSSEAADPLAGPELGPGFQVPFAVTGS